MIWEDSWGGGDFGGDFGRGGAGEDWGTLKETDFFGFEEVLMVDCCGSCFGKSSSMFARRRNFSSRDEPIEDISSSRSCWICEGDMDFS